MNSASWKRKVFANLDKICLDPLGNFANSEEVEKHWTWGDYYDTGEAKKHDQFKIKTEKGEELDLIEYLKFDSWSEDYVEIREALINSIKQTPDAWEIFADGSNSQRGNFLKNKINGVKHYKSGITIFIDKVDGIYDEQIGQRDWDEIEEIVKKANPVKNDQPNPTKNTPEKKWYKPTDYPLSWTIGVILTLIAVFILFLIRRSRKRKSY